MVVNGRDAAAAMAHAGRDAVLTDCLMPGMDGDIAERIDAETLGSALARHLDGGPAPPPGG